MADTDPQPSEIVEEEDFNLEIKFGTVRSARMKMFSDAVWAIIATIMITPTMHMDISEKIKTHHDMHEIIRDILPEVLLYFLAFLIICTTWACHVWTFQTMRKVTDLSIVFNLVVLLAGSFIPYFYTLMSRFRTWQTVVMYCSLQISIGLFQLAIVFHAFSYPGILSKRIDEQPEDKRKETRWKILSHVLVAPCFSLVSICVSFASPNAAIICLAMMLVYPWVQSLAVFVMSRFRKCAKFLGRRRRQLERTVLLTERIKKERIEAFSYGVFAITSTLLVLDITEKYLPKKEGAEQDVNRGAYVVTSLSENWGVFVGYILTFLLIGLLWFTHLSLFKRIEKISRMMLFVNNWILACVGMLPLAFTFVLHFRITASLRTGVQFGCAALFLGGIFTTLFYVIALMFARHNDDEEWMCRSVQPGGNDFGVMIFQLVAAPISAAIVFGLTYLKNTLIAVYLGASLIVVYAIALIVWKTVKATFFEEDEPSRGEYSVMKMAESVTEEVEGGGEEE